MLMTQAPPPGEKNPLIPAPEAIAARLLAIERERRWLRKLMDVAIEEREQLKHKAAHYRAEACAGHD